MTITLLLGGVGPAAAQSQDSILCNAEPIPGLIEAAIRVLTYGGLMGALIFALWSYIQEMIRPDSDSRAYFRGRRRQAMIAATGLVVLGPLFDAFAAATGLPLAQCIDVAPW